VTIKYIAVSDFWEHLGECVLHRSGSKNLWWTGGQATQYDSRDELRQAAGEAQRNRSVSDTDPIPFRIEEVEVPDEPKVFLLRPSWTNSETVIVQNEAKAGPSLPLCRADFER
jgi:hypothetical protein